MKTIEERAIEYATITDPLRPGDAPRIAMRVDEHLAEAFIAGAISERAELTRWNDPDDIRPDNLQRVLVKYKKADGSSKVGIATFHHLLGIGRGSFVMEASRPQYILGWRPIHE